MAQATQITFTEPMQKWWRGLAGRDRARVGARIDQLATRGRSLGEPAAKPLARARHHGMMELRPSGTPLRVMFAFDGDRRAVMLTGINKGSHGRTAYDRGIAKADRLLDERQNGARREITWDAIKAGTRSGGRAR